MNRKTNMSFKAIMNKELKGKTILITGGGGSIGSHLTKKILEYPIKTVRVLDIDEHALFRLSRSLNDSRLRLLLGNVLDKERIEIAAKNVNIIIHSAAVKNIEISEFNPIETIDTNINGTTNMIKMAIRNMPEKFLNISTDKAADPSTLYGTTKQLSERLTSWAGFHVKTTKFASVRFGNVIETRGNVFEIWNEELKSKLPLSITDPNMNRYFFSVDEAVNFILQCLSMINEGEIFVPKMKSYNIKELASKISKNHKIIGVRQGEKMKEILITEAEKKQAKENRDMWIISPYGH
ncbi:MAG: SDR family NAD(P)-dependent oxidoreductase [Thaumarchaeota archaeon]|nr:MAG: SDR family NAD(P)-dependent oxidoreductase [Nitrososphaerota archaeon]